MHADRLARVRAARAEQRVDACLLSVGPDLPWLIGYEAMPLERLTMLVVPRDGVATLLAGRLEMVESFLSDLQHQYRDHDGGLGMIGEVLGALAHHHGPTKLSPGSERDPDPLF